MPLLLARSLVVLSFVGVSRTFYKGFTLRPCNQSCLLMPEKSFLGLTEEQGSRNYLPSEGAFAVNTRTVSPYSPEAKTNDIVLFKLSVRCTGFLQCGY